MRLTFTLRLLFTCFAFAGLTACSKEVAPPLPTPTASYKLDGTLVTCRVVVYPPCAVYNGEQLLVRLFTTPTPARGEEYLDLSLVKQPTEPNGAYKINWVRYNANGIEPGGMLLRDVSLTLAVTNTGIFSGTATGGAALYPNSVFSAVTEVVFNNAHF